MRNILKTVLSSVIFLGIVSSALAMWPLFSGEDAVGQKAVGFSLLDTSGKSVDTAQFIGKKPVVLFFWTTWCPHCRRQIARLHAEAENLKKLGAEIVLVDVGESKAQVSGFLKGINSPFTSLLDEDSAASEKYKVVGVPTFVIIAQDGTVKYRDNSLPQDYEKIIAGK